MGGTVSDFVGSDATCQNFKRWKVSMSTRRIGWYFYSSPSMPAFHVQTKVHLFQMDKRQLTIQGVFGWPVRAEWQRGKLESEEENTLDRVGTQLVVGSKCRLMVFIEQVRIIWKYFTYNVNLCNSCEREKFRRKCCIKYRVGVYGHC